MPSVCEEERYNGPRSLLVVTLQHRSKIECHKVRGRAHGTCIFTPPPLKQLLNVWKTILQRWGAQRTVVNGEHSTLMSPGR